MAPEVRGAKRNTSSDARHTGRLKGAIVIELGICDPDVTDAACVAYEQEVSTITRLPLKEVPAGADKFVAARTPHPGMPVIAVQRALRSIGFFPGGKADGICGYRTTSAIRLFQEYVRTIEKLPSTPDGRFGPLSEEHLRRWLDRKLQPYWTATVEQWRDGTLGPSEYTEWLSLLDKVKARYAAQPTPMLQLVNDGPASDTRKVANWDFTSVGTPQLIGIRRQQATGKFDDIFVILLKGLVFKFQGSTEPGMSENPRGTPFLVQGQHDYHFGWHKRTYLALRPRTSGVLVVRSKSDRQLDDGDLANGVEVNATINIHWGGMGQSRDVKSWSEGCQVINGATYLNASGEAIDCSPFGAITPSEATNAATRKTRGAYTVLLDLVTALASDLTGNQVRYMLLVEDDLALAPALADKLAEARTKLVRI